MTDSNDYIIYIYGLYSSLDINKKIRYIGKTSNLCRRKKEHLSEINKKECNNSYKKNWIKKVIRNNGKIEIVVLEKCNRNNWADREKYWIKLYKKRNNLVNVTPGGESFNRFNYEINYNDCRIWVSKNLPNIKSVKKWLKNSNNLPNYIPKDPQGFFEGNGWISWGDFLNSGKIHDNKMAEKYINYVSVKEWMFKNLKINYRSEWLLLVKNKEIPYFIPNRPDRFYNSEDRGWISWSDFLSSSKNISSIEQHEMYLTYNDCVEFIRNNYSEIKTQKEWDYYEKNNLFPFFVPRFPHNSYKNEGWVNWGDFLNSNDLSKKEKINLNKKKFPKTAETFYRKCPKCDKGILHKNKTSKDRAEKNNTVCSSCSHAKTNVSLEKMKQKYLIFDECRNNEMMKLLNLHKNNWHTFKKHATQLFRKFKKETKPEKYFRNCPDCNIEISYSEKLSRDNANIRGGFCRTCAVKGDRNGFYGKKHKASSVIKANETKMLKNKIHLAA